MNSHVSQPLVDFRVERITHKIAKPFIERWHYSKNCPTGQNWFFGAFIDKELYAVVDYGIGANMDGGKSMAAMTGLPVTRENHVTLKRLCRKGAKGKAKIAMTKLLSICHKMLKRENNIRFVISYADPTENGSIKRPKKRTTLWQAGGIYAAANFKYLGKVAPERHFMDRKGNFVHRRVPYRLKNRRNAATGGSMTMPEAQKELGLKPWVMAPKDRWFLDLGENRARPPSEKRIEAGDKRSGRPKKSGQAVGRRVTPSNRSVVKNPGRAPAQAGKNNRRSARKTTA